MGSLADLIEQYLQQLLAQANQVELQRRELAKMFRCVPSQINYVLETRFTVDRGYLIESRRGGGGFIRIYRIQKELPRRIADVVPEQLTREEAEELLETLAEQGEIHEEQALLARYILEQSLQGVAPEVEPLIRAKLLAGILMVYKDRDNY
ncbi:MAG TPA: CtsR family transcriptional regulator [Firmicutes bacterium]|jgi:transcriptional regulator CtsR|nr:CtsR family transcriptional regulator [Bacillota bacterium]HOQ24362.1 CtsR family transcriptional regulator [Bacillota bacterium]HPT67669.1 CtsR family transcriptional regulator [Bacillota bacterium]